MFAGRVPGGGSDGDDVTLIDLGSHIVLDNGIVRLTLSKPGGLVTSLSYGGLDNIMEVANAETNRGYWDLNWSFPGKADNFDVHYGTFFRVISNDGDKVEVSFLRRYEPEKSMVPLHIDKRFVLLRGNTGFYTYGIYERPEGWPAFNLNQTRVTFKLRNDRFHYMAVSDSIQRIMPSGGDRSPNKCEQLAYPEAVLLTDPQNPSLRGEVDDKYQYSQDNKDGQLHGWACADPLIGFWVIMPSNEFRNGGPTKQNLQSHTGPTCLSMFHSAHYAGEVLCASFGEGEAWQKVLGPVFIYLNSARLSLDPRYLWEDAKQQMFVETNAWPYDWPASPDFVKSRERGSIIGKLVVQDKYISPENFPASFACIGLANPGENGSWQTESKGYQFWSQADANGYFRIKDVRPGVYDVYAFVPGVMGNYKKEGTSIVVHEGSSIDLGGLVFEPPRDGPTLWEIGVPDRTAAHFFVPEPDPRFINRVFVDHSHRYRHYGHWLRYSQLYPDGDLVYTVGTSDWKTDWFFIHCCRIQNDGTMKPSTWEIKFHLDTVIQNRGPYKFRLALAASNNAAIQVRVNDPSVYTPLFDTMQIGKDNAIARHGIHGLYSLWSIDIQPGVLRTGFNSIFLTQRKASSPFNGVMYDYLRLESP